MTWRYPAVFAVYLVIIMILFLWQIRKRRLKRHLVKHKQMLNKELFENLDSKRDSWKQNLYMIGLAFLIIAAAGPQVGTRVRPVERKGVDLIFGIDVSISMDAEDVKPSRIEKAKFEISQILRQLKGDRVGIITFAGSSYYYLPMTTDYEAAQIFLKSIDTKMITTQGTQLSAAINTAINIFPKENDKFKVLVLVTDGEDHEGEAVGLAKKSSKAGIVIHTVGVGSEAGSLIPIKDEKGNRIGYKKDRAGKLVTSAINTKILKQIASAGNGISIRLDNRKGSYKDLIQALDQMEKKTISTHEFSEFEDRYQIFANIGIFFLVFAFLLRTKPRIKKVK